MYQTVNSNDFRNAFKTHGREDQFSADALDLLFDHLEEMEEGEPGQELDVITICCDFTEDSPRSIAESYNIDIEDCGDDDEVMNTVEKYLLCRTNVVGTTDDTIVYLNF